MRRILKIVAVAALVTGFVASAPAAAQTRSGLKATDLFRLADQALAARRPADAVAIYQALTHDPDIEIRSEARFRLGMLLSSQGKNAEAAVQFRALVDEKPDAERVRLELARVLALLGDLGAARRELRQAQAGALPAEVRQVVDQFANALRSHKPFGASFELAVAPDSNINRATSAQTLDTIIAPLQLSRDARETSGIGIKPSGQAYARLPLSPTLSVVPRISGQAALYRQSAFDDISGSALIGLEWAAGRERISPSVGGTYRWYGGHLYARTETATLDWQHPLGRRAQLDGQVSVAHSNYLQNDLQDGMLYDANLGYERALSRRSGGSVTFDVTRQTATDPGYANVAGGATLLYWRELGHTTAFLTGTARRLEGDARLFLYPERRRETFWRVGAGATLRALQVKGFAPLVRASWERNVSTIGIYDYRRVSVDLGITRAF